MSLKPGSLKKAPCVGAFFLLVAWLQPAAADVCSPTADAEPVRVRYVHDGDTLVLSDERKIRLLGINTPETARDGEPTQALAIRARDRLRQLLFQHGNRAQLLYGNQKQDRYGRHLAHLWSPDGENLSARLLSEGLGWAIVIPPNTQLAACYVASAEKARNAAEGVWGHPAYAAKPSKTLNLRMEGFSRVQGRITRVNHGGGATWINLEGHFAIRIPDQDLQWFPNPPARSWVGREAEVQGWLYATKGELRVTVQHPSALRLVSQP